MPVAHADPYSLTIRGKFLETDLEFFLELAGGFVADSCLMEERNEFFLVDREYLGEFEQFEVLLGGNRVLTSILKECIFV